MEPNGHRAAQAKREFIRMMRWIAIIGVLMVVGALTYLAHEGSLEPATIGATIAGVFFSVLLGCGLFAAAFFSHKSGYDDIAANSRSRADD